MTLTKTDRDMLLNALICKQEQLLETSASCAGAYRKTIDGYYQDFNALYERVYHADLPYTPEDDV